MMGKSKAKLQLAELMDSLNRAHVAAARIAEAGRGVYLDATDELLSEARRTLTCMARECADAAVMVGTLAEMRERERLIEQLKKASES